MIYNATLLRIDPPAPGEAGLPLSIRCAAVDPTAAQVDSLEPATATLVLYARPGDLPGVDQPVAGGVACVRLDGRSAADYRIVRVVEHVGGGVLSHLELAVAP